MKEKKVKKQIQKQKMTKIPHKKKSVQWEKKYGKNWTNLFFSLSVSDQSECLIVDFHPLWQQTDHKLTK